MDNQTNSILAICGLATSVLTAAVAVINHKRIRSNCCGKTLDVSVDIESTTPPSRASA